MKEKSTIINTMWERYKINERIKEKYENKSQHHTTTKKNILKSNKENLTK
jgi:hypothetical protein